MLQLLPVLKAENEILTANGSLSSVVALWPLLAVLTVNSKGVVLWYKTYPGFGLNIWVEAPPPWPRGPIRGLLVATYIYFWLHLPLHVSGLTLDLTAPLCCSMDVRTSQAWESLKLNSLSLTCPCCLVLRLLKIAVLALPSS